jgi:aspartate/methionine/tyrosine aminotransferase
MSFPSSRLPTDLSPNRLTQALRRARQSRQPLLDLTLTNPTAAGFDYPADVLAPLAAADGLRYEPHAFGLPVAREAVAGDYRRRGIEIDTDRIVLTASTSEAYSVLFKLLCQPWGDDVLVPAPSYPLFDHLTRLDGVRAVPYRLEYHGRWSVDLSSVDAAWTDRTRAVLAVSPNNPTGSVLTAAELRELRHRCAERGAALILDEVFADYPLQDGRPPEIAADDSSLTFRLGGLSKSAGLPQVKLGWIGLEGPPSRVTAALEGLELVCDTYLSVSTPVQVAAPALIRSGAAVRVQILDRVRRNYGALRQASDGVPAVQVLACEGGWSAVLRVPATRSEDDLVLGLLEDRHVLVHPGYFFDFPHEAFLVFSLLPRPDVFDRAIGYVLERADA